MCSYRVHRGRAGGWSAAAAATRRRPPPLVVFNKREYYGVRIDGRGSFFSIVERNFYGICVGYKYIMPLAEYGFLCMLHTFAGASYCTCEKPRA
uniref:Uncharacterized protein n=1 Tax=Trichogramma kaykai TaxID=54128 RepID=A0ABD2WX68_9HYME